MADGRFDALARLLLQSFSRRRLPQLLLTALAARGLADDALAKKKKKTKTKKPITCKPACRDGETCVNGVCRCASGTICGGICCTAGRICDNVNRCCSPPAKQSTCQGKCGDLANTCGQPVSCGDCTVQVCQTAACTGNTCTYVNVPDNQQAPNCDASGQLCCHGSCCNGVQTCFEQRCCAPESVTETCEGKCGAVANNCGQEVTCAGCGNGFSCDESECRCSTGVLCNGGSVCCGAGQICQSNSCQTPPNVDYEYAFILPRQPPRIPLLHSVAVDSLGNAYVTDYDNDRVVKYDFAGQDAGDWGSSGRCGGASEPPCSDEQFNVVFAGPTGIAVNASNEIFVADSGNNRILKLSNEVGFLAQWGGSALDHPQGLAIDAAGSLYVADAGHDRVLKFDEDGAFLTSIGASGPDRVVAPTWVAVSADGKTVYVAGEAADTIAIFARSESDQFAYELVTRWQVAAAPRGLAVDGQGRVYVADDAQYVIRKLTSEGVIVATWGSRGSGNGEFLDPRGLAAIGNSVYAVDGETGRIQKFVPSGSGATFILEFGPAPDGNGQFREPAALATGPGATFYVADSGNFRVQELTTFSASFVRAWGGFGTGAGKFERPAGIAVSADGSHVYVSDSTSGRVQQFTAGGTFVATLGEPGQFARPRGIDVDGAGNVYIVDEAGDRIYKFSSAGALIDDWDGSGTAAGTFASPHDVAFGAGHVYVADTGNHRVQKFTPTGTHVMTWGGFGSGAGQCNAPQGIAVDDQGNVYVADTGNHRWQKFTSDGVFVTKKGAHGAGDGQFNHSTGIAVDEEGSVFVADRDNHRIQKYIPTGAGRARPEQARQSARDDREESGVERQQKPHRRGRNRRQRGPARPRGSTRHKPAHRRRGKET